MKDTLTSPIAHNTNIKRLLFLKLIWIM